MIDRRRAASVFGASMLLLSLVAFGVTVPVGFEDGGGGATDAPSTAATSYDIETTEYGGYMTQDADGALLTTAVVGTIALSAGVGGTLILTGYFDKSPDGQTEASYMVKNLEDRIETDYSTLNSSYEETRTMAYRVAETEFAESMANGSSKIEAQTHADKEVKEYLRDTIEDEFVRRQNAYVSTFTAISTTDGVNIQFGGFVENSIVSSVNDTVTYLGKTYNISKNKISGGNEYYWLGRAEGGWTAKFDSGSISDKNIDAKQSEFDALASKYASIHGEVSNEISNFSESVSESQYENLSADEIVSPVNQALEWGQSYEDTGSSGYANALAGSLGYNTSDLGTTYTLDTPNNGTINGTLYGDFENVGVNDTLSGDGVQYVATDDGQNYQLSGGEEVERIELKNGTAVNETEFSAWSRDELNASAPLETLNEWQSLKQNLSDGGLFGGGLFGSSGPLGVSWIVWIIGGFGVLLIATRD